MKRKKNSNLQKASFVFESIAKEVGLSSSVELLRIKKQWTTLFDIPVSQHTEPVLLEDRQLVINVDSNIWLTELFYQREKILKKLVSFNVKSIKLRAGNVSKHSIADIPEGNPVKKLDASEIEFINTLGVKIEDNELRQAIKKAAERSLSHKGDYDN
jgi:hypothetical protein